MKAQYEYRQANGKAYAVHRQIIEDYLGRKLKENEVVHHINGDGFDNRVENMIVMTRAQHSVFHAKEREVIIDCICSKCGVRFPLKSYQYRLRMKRNKSGNIYCTKKCAPHFTFKEKLIGLSKLIEEELSNGLTGYAIAKKHNLNKRTVYLRIKKLRLSKKRDGIVVNSSGP